MVEHLSDRKRNMDPYVSCAIGTNPLTLFLYRPLMLTVGTQGGVGSSEVLWVLRWAMSSEVSYEFWGEWVVLRWPMRGRVPERHRSLPGVSFLLMVLTTPWALHCETQSSSQYLPWPVQKEKLLKKQLVWRLSFMSWDFTKCITKFQSWQLTLTPVTLLTLLI